jgi:hypothetical protein
MTGERQVRLSLFRGRLLAAAVVVVTGVAPAAGQGDGAAVRIVVLKEHGVGSQSLAQPYLNKFVAIAGEQNGWAEAKGQYFTSRDAASKFIETEKPHYGILSLAAFLALRDKYHLAVIGEVAASLAGGRQYFLISKSTDDLAGCKAKALVTDHADDPRFIDRVVADGNFKLTDFTLVRAQRPLQTIRQLMNGEAACALIDDAQQAELAHLDGAAGIRTVWKSAEFPPMVIAAFPAAPAAERQRFQETLGRVCDHDGENICGEVGIVSLKATGDASVASLVTAYGR